MNILRLLSLLLFFAFSAHIQAEPPVLDQQQTHQVISTPHSIDIHFDSPQTIVLTVAQARTQHNSREQAAVSFSAQKRRARVFFDLTARRVHTIRAHLVPLYYVFALHKMLD